MEDNKIETIEEIKLEVKTPEKPKDIIGPVVKHPNKKSNKKVIILTVLITLAILIGGYYAYQYELDRNKTSYDEGYINGLLYTQTTGNIVFLINGNVTEIQMPGEWKTQIQQYLNQQGGQ